MSRERKHRGVLPPSSESIDKLENTVNAGNYYGAQQMYKSISARYVAAQRHSEALDILQSGACIQLKKGQVTCGSELAVLFIDILVKAKMSYDQAILERLKKIYLEFPRIPIPHDLREDEEIEKFSEALGAAKTRVDCCSSFLKAAIKWSAEFGGPKTGSPELHVMLAEYIYSESPDMEMTKVTIHFVRGNCPEKFVATLINFMGKCYSDEDDLAIARAILMYLSVGNLRDANFIIEELGKQLEFMEMEFPESDLIEFIAYLLQTLERDAFPLFRMLRQHYKSSIDREPMFHELLDEIAEKFYGVRRKSGMQGIFGDFLKMMGGEVPV